MNFSNENLLIIIVLISIVIIFLTSDSICKNKEQFVPLNDDIRKIIDDIRNNPPASSQPVCDPIKCGYNLPVCNEECKPTYSFARGDCTGKNLFGTCIKWKTITKTNPCGTRGLVCKPSTPKCC